ncbi:patatin-like phospholipase family protein [Hymenobacter monticola]|uniref:Patatin-like phospholipase family protein n=1 Tax=Hymenobacter monticola TaxID=1705399 RepID=A0ABY4BBA1_9BACT|nr:patatin-like phospholipase family protein [Hymenobacter monticola]UOE36438.1 patatin-like phospholipase family protein [Hymenobacter monticola]
MRLPYLFIALLLVTCPMLMQAQTPAARPRIGLTLGGGGARGLAHIGLLKALDSAQVRVDYVSGTSMGAVVGALYAEGYTGAEIERIAQAIDWNAMLSNATPLAALPLAERDESGRYIAELPLTRKGLQLPGGLLESQELWLKLIELYFPFYRTKNFDDFERKFRCVATDVVAGQPVVLRQGEIASAVRASMAIPSVFSPVEYQGRRLVDGGVVRNFPVSEAQAMGATYVIGSSVSGEANTQASLRNALDILLQIAFFKDNDDFKQQKARCNLYVDYPLDGFGVGSFSSGPAIIARGLARGRALYPRLRALQDSLDAKYGPVAPLARAPRADSVYLTGVEMKGVEPRYVPRLLQLMRFQDHRYYTAPQLSAAIRQAFSTRYFRRITYVLQPTAGTADAATIVFEVDPAPLTLVGLGLHYNTATGIGLIASISSKDLLLPGSTSQLKFNLGENPRARLVHTQLLSHDLKWSGRLFVQGEQVSITTYAPDFTKAGLYTQGFVNADARVTRSLGLSRALGVGTSYEYLVYHPEITSRLQPDGRIRQVNTYAYYEANTLNTMVYPTRGRRVYAEAGYVYAQRPSGAGVSDSTVVLGIHFQFTPYTHTRFSFAQYLPLTKTATLLLQAQAGLNFNYKQAVFNDFVVGGLNSVVRNQVTFAGVPEAALLTGSAATALVGYQFALTPSLFATAKANVLYHDFITGNVRLQAAKANYGGSLTLGLKTIVGPIDASIMYSDLSKSFLTYFNIGLPFGYR